MTKRIVMVGFLIAFAAGLVIGIESRQSSLAPPEKEPRRGGWLTTELNLTPQQQEQLKQIWSEIARHGGRERDDRRRQLYRQRDEAIAALIRPEDQPKYQQVLQEFEEKKAALEAEGRQAFQTAIERTKQILSEEQRVKYDQLLQHRQWERGSRDRRRGPDRGHGACRWRPEEGRTRSVSQS
ncbi:MAG: hypothetical protein AMXMBFR13_28700 [Phycisphaerae bacterium]